MQKKMNDNVEHLQTRDFLENSITNFDVYNAIIEQNYMHILKDVVEQNYTSATYPVLKNISTGTIGLTGTIVGMIATGGVASIAKIGFSLLSTTFNIFLDVNKPSESATAVWEKIKKYAEEYVGKEFDVNQFNRLMSELDGCKDSVALYLDYRKKADPAALYYCRSAIALFTQRISTFQQKGYEILSLPLFVQVARLLLLLYRDLVLYGESWNISPEDRAKDKKMMKKLIKQFSEYAFITYLSGLEDMQQDETKIWKSPCCDINQDRKLQEKVFPFTKHWNAINQYKKGMQLSVFDIVAQFPTLDPETYPLIGTNIKQSREVFSRITGAIIKKEHLVEPSQTNVSTMEQIDNLLPAGYEGELIDVRTKVGKLTPPTGYGNIKYPLYSMDQVIDKVTGAAMGKSYRVGPFKPSEETWFPSNHIVPLDMVGSCCDTEHGLVNNFYAGSSMVAFPPEKIKCKINPDKHKLSSVTLLGTFKTWHQVDWPLESYGFISSGLICGFRQSDLNPKHILSSSLITQIPAEMNANNGRKGFRNVSENITGQNVMRAQTNGSYLEYDVFGIENATTHCEIRLYLSYGGNRNSSIDIAVSHLEPNSPGCEWHMGKEQKIGNIPLDISALVENSIRGMNGYYSLTKKVPIIFGKGRSKIKLAFKSDNDLNTVMIDRIEIIPVKTETEISGKNGKVFFTVHQNGKLEAEAMGDIAIDGVDSKKTWKVFVCGQDKFDNKGEMKELIFYGQEKPKDIASTFNKIFSESTSEWIIPGNTLSVLDFTEPPIPQETIPLGKYNNQKKILELVKVNDIKNEQLLMRKTATASEADLENEVGKDYSVFAGGKLVYRCKKGTKFKTVMNAFNALNIRAYSAKIVEDNEKMNPKDTAKDMIDDLFPRTDNNKPDYANCVKPHIVSYDTRVAKNALRTMHKNNIPIPDDFYTNLRLAEERIFIRENSQACLTDNNNITTMLGLRGKDGKCVQGKN
ncbi:insecticidal delta-endotoxin Cry8Ea1 family protein [Bacillus toyonensis]|uniref:insecticidal delta-endotoxin Cry8Ea1 family protein n=1 Tax=Bacillus toyonensis TaxID=155322 RepID=UPI00321C1DF0